VKPNRSPDAGINNRFSPGRFAYVNTPLAVFISNAYRFPPDVAQATLVATRPSISMPPQSLRKQFQDAPADAQPGL
jgi:hypothetical protein